MSSVAGSRRWWALGAVVLGVLAVGLDATVLNVALPTLATALNASASELQWFSVAYALALAAMMLPAGLLGDRYGRKKVLLGSIALFAAGSVGCAYSESSDVFILARVLMGVAGAGMITMAMSALMVLFSESERPKAVGVWSAANLVAMPIGPLLGGWLLTHYWWGWVFLINAPVAALGLVAVAMLVPESRSTKRPGLDLVGVLSSGAGLSVLTYGMVEAGKRGWADSGAWGWMIGGALMLVAFAWWQRRVARHPNGEPLVDPSLFGSRGFTWGVLLMALGFVAMVGVLFTMPQYFQAILGTDAQGSGLRLLPTVIGVMVGAVAADRVARGLGRKLTAAVGFAVLAVGMVVGTGIAVDSGDGFVALWMSVSGIGIGLAGATCASAALVEVPVERSGVGSGVVQAIQKLGVPLGTAVLGSVLNSIYRGEVDVTGLPANAVAAVQKSVFAGVAVTTQANSGALLESVRNAFVSGLSGTLWISAAIALVCLLLALAFLPRGSERVDARTPARAESRNGVSI